MKREVATRDPSELERDLLDEHKDWIDLQEAVEDLIEGNDVGFWYCEGAQRYVELVDLDVIERKCCSLARLGRKQILKVFIKRLQLLVRLLKFIDVTDAATIKSEDRILITMVVKRHADVLNCMLNRKMKDLDSHEVDKLELKKALATLHQNPFDASARATVSRTEYYIRSLGRNLLRWTAQKIKRSGTIISKVDPTRLYGILVPGGFTVHTEGNDSKVAEVELEARHRRILQATWFANWSQWNDPEYDDPVALDFTNRKVRAVLGKTMSNTNLSTLGKIIAFGDPPLRFIENRYGQVPLKLERSSSARDSSHERVVSWMMAQGWTSDELARLYP